MVLRVCVIGREQKRILCIFILKRINVGKRSSTNFYAFCIKRVNLRLGFYTFQVHSGMAGMIIVEDPTSGPMAAPQHLANVSCPNNCQHDIQLLFQPTLSYINNARRGFANLQRTIQDDQLFR